jgi:hypothetical protein
MVYIVTRTMFDRRNVQRLLRIYLHSAAHGDAL